jgi:parvulin-like peptidyl-prolyl isomerase
MSALTVQLPESLHRSILAIAEREGYSVDQFLASAAAEKLAALMTVDYLRREAAEARREDFEQFLASVPNREPVDTDRITD